MEASLQTTEITSGTKQVFTPQETVDHPFDVTLVVEDGKQFKAHRRVLSEGSPFFEKLFNSDMREANEGIVRLQVLTELGLRDLLKFIYTGSVQISAEDNAQELIVMADYFILPYLKTLAGRVLGQKMNASNCISTHCFAEKYRCEELILDAKNFIFANFLTVAKTENFLNLSSEEILTWISSDEIDVNAEEDVFKIIIAWIDHEENERKKYFAELLREVRLVYISRDFLRSDVVTNDFVNDNEGCMDLVNKALKFIDSKSYQHSTVQPRKSLETPVVIVYEKCLFGQDHILCYHPRKDTWSRFPGTVPPNTQHVVSCHGKLYFISQRENCLLCYDSFSDCWMSLPYDEQRSLLNVFVLNESEIYSLVSEDISCCQDCDSLRRARGINSTCGKTHVSFLTKYKPESNSWQDITSFDLGAREGICLVAKDGYIYFLGGYTNDRYEYLRDADRYDLSTNTWDKIDDLQEPRRLAGGAAAHGKIFIIGGISGYSGSRFNCIRTETCEVFDENTNKWQPIAGLRKERWPNYKTAVCVDGKLYILSVCNSRMDQESRIVECYDPAKDEWYDKTEMPLQMMPSVNQWDEFISYCCSMTVFNGCDFLRNLAFLA